MVGDHYDDIFRPRPWYPSIPNWPSVPDGGPASIPGISRQEFDALKREVEDMKKLLIRAKEYDERNGEPDCEMEDKVALLKKIAKAVGVDLSEVFGK
jgi:hypothetical protein